MTEQMKNEIKEHLEEENQAWGLGLIKTLEEENKELIDKLNLQNQRLNELKKENEELKKKIFIQDEIVIGEQTENKELKAIISKLKCCGNCKHWRYSCLNEDYICKRTEEIIKSLECYTEKMDKCDKWELAE